METKGDQESWLAAFTSGLYAKRGVQRILNSHRLSVYSRKPNEQLHPCKAMRNKRPT